MAYDSVAARYAQALFEAVKAEEGIDAALSSLTRIGALLREQADLRALLLNPDVDPEDKIGVLDRILQGTWPGLVRAFVQMVVSAGRSELLADMVDAFHDIVEADQGRLRVIVRSARPLSDAALTRLRATLEHREGKRIELRAESAPELLGGMQVVLGSRLIDGSVKRQLLDLRQRLQSVRVY